MNICTSDHTAVRLLTDYPHRFARQGAVVAAWRTYRECRLGPQGRASPQPKLHKHAHKPSTKTLARFHLRPRPSRQNLTQLQQKSGTKLLECSEIRGMRQTGPRLSAAHVPPHLIPEFPFPLPGPLAELAAPKPEFSPSVDQNNPHQSPFKPNVGQLRNPAFTELRPHNAHKPRTKTPNPRARFPKEIAGSCHRRSRSPPPAPKQPASACSPMERGLPVLHPENRRNHLQYKTLATPWLMHLSIDVCTTERTNHPMAWLAIDESSGRLRPYVSPHLLLERRGSRRAFAVILPSLARG